MEGLYGEYLSDEALSINTPITQFPATFDRGENLVERPIHHSILIEIEIEDACQRRERVGHLIKTYSQSTRL